jgi:hypothetical protein
VEPDELAQLSADHLEHTVFTLPAACKILHLKWAANAYLQSFRDECAPQVIENGTEYLCVVRHTHEVHRLVLDAPEYALLIALANGQPMGTALEQVATHFDPMALVAQLPHYLSRWLQNGMLCTFSAGNS